MVRRISEDQKKIVIEQLKGKVQEIRELLKVSGVDVINLSIDENSASIRCYDSDFDVCYCSASWHDLMIDPDWIEIADVDGWNIELEDR